VARGYRKFLLQPGGRGGHCYFTGESQSRPYRDGHRVRYRNVARYFTPTEVTQQMVRMARPRANERVLDMTCGSGSFLAESVDYVAREEGEGRARRFLTQRLVGIDDDPFCVSCSRALLTFLYPQHADELRVFLHNALYERAPRRSEIDEDPQAEPHLRAGRYDLVIGNPPGNDEYSGTNREEITRQWRERFGHAQGGLMDHHCFIHRAVELASPDGGRVCLLVPEGLLARDNRGMLALRNTLLENCRLKAVISLPRVFKNNNARMAIVYLVRCARPRLSHKAFLAEVHERWRDTNGQQQITDVFGELEAIVDRFLSEC
jgi:type I restriction enzyme M protein